MPSSDLYDEHMQVRTFDERLDVKADIRKINEAIEGMKQSYRIVDRLGEGGSKCEGIIVVVKLTRSITWTTFRLSRNILLGLQSHRHRRLYLRKRFLEEDHPRRSQPESADLHSQDRR